MVKAIIFLLCLSFAVMAFAVEDRIEVAKFDNNINLQKKNRVAMPLVTEKYKYYEIRGNNENELRRQMSQNGTKWNDGRTYDALTTWEVSWDYGYSHGPQGYTVDSFKPTVEIIFRYPKWVRTPDAPSALISRWDGYMKNLMTHENGHRDMAVQAAAELSRVVAQLPPAMSKAELDKEVQVLGHKLMAKLDNDERQYDVTTIHGTTQGAVFP